MRFPIKPRGSKSKKKVIGGGNGRLNDGGEGLEVEIATAGQVAKL